MFSFLPFNKYLHAEHSTSLSVLSFAKALGARAD